MRKLSFCLLLILCSFAAAAQKKKTRRQPPSPSNTIMLEDFCIKKFNLPLVERLKNYPFDVAQSVQIVSFNFGGLDDGIVKRDSSGKKIENVLYFGLPTSKDSMIAALLTESVTLSPIQIDSLTSILYNYGPKEPDPFLSTYACYEPRNAIVLLDAGRKIIAYVDICFHCKQMQKSTKRMNLGTLCEGKYELLKAYFRAAGIRNGTD